MSTTIRRAWFDTETEAIAAQRECVCAKCGAHVKYHYAHGIWSLFCIANPTHRNLKAAQ